MTQETQDSIDPLDQSQTPYLKQLQKEKSLRYTSFQMPGHKETFSPPQELVDYWGDNLYPADINRMNDTLGYLHASGGALGAAQKLAAQAFGADTTFFLVNGSSVGNIAAIMSVVRDGEKILIPRASHRSIYTGLMMSGAVPIYVEPVYNPDITFPMGVDVEVVQQMADFHIDLKAIHVTSPNYYGFTRDVQSMVVIAHAHTIPLVVDEAHGSHLGFHPGLPQSAVRMGADLVVQSTHKTLTALTQASMLHCNPGLINLTKVAQMVSSLQSTSPSALLLASLDSARQLVATRGADLIDRALHLAYKARRRIQEIEGLWCYGDEILGKNGIFTYDPTRLVIRVCDLGLTGYEFAHLLMAEHNVEVEFSDLKHIICTVSIADSQESVGLLLHSLEAIVSTLQPQTVDHSNHMTSFTRVPDAVISPRSAFFAASVSVPIAQAIDQVAAEYIIPYPPGIPLIVPGEKIDAEVVEYFQMLAVSGAKILGLEDSSLQHVRIVDHV